MAETDSKKPYQTFPGIHPRAYEHPADRAALVGLRKMKGFDEVLKKILGLVGERRLRLMYLGASVRVGPKQLPRVNGLLGEACEILDVEPVPDLFVVQNPRLNAGAIGFDRPFVVINSSMLGTMTDDELRCVIGHEVAHILSGHALYMTMFHVLRQLLNTMFVVPILPLSLPLLIALFEWKRKAELSADRAGLLVCQDLAVAQRVDLKLAGGLSPDELDLEEFERQAREYEEGGSVVDNVFKLLNMLFMTHPYPVLRIAELRRWAESDAYADILAGDYPRRGEEPAMEDEVQEAARSYRDGFDDAKDSLSELVKSAVQMGQSVVGTLFEDPWPERREKDVTPGDDELGEGDAPEPAGG